MNEICGRRKTQSFHSQYPLAVEPDRLANGQRAKRLTEDSVPILQIGHLVSPTLENLCKLSLVGKQPVAVLQTSILCLPCDLDFQILPLRESKGVEELSPPPIQYANLTLNSWNLSGSESICPLDNLGRLGCAK